MFPRSVQESAFTARFVSSRNCTVTAAHEGKTHSENFHFEERIILIWMLKEKRLHSNGSGERQVGGLFCSWK